LKIFGIKHYINISLSSFSMIFRFSRKWFWSLMVTNFVNELVTVEATENEWAFSLWRFCQPQIENNSGRSPLCLYLSFSFYLIPSLFICFSFCLYILSLPITSIAYLSLFICIHLVCLYPSLLLFSLRLFLCSCLCINFFFFIFFW
jgi:hypothetical protein